MSKNCVISAVGKNSLHRQWLMGQPAFDLHLIVYDDSFQTFMGDTPYVCQLRGYKLRIVYEYLCSNPDILGRYDYFFLPDDDISMDSKVINSLFESMRFYDLEIGQPSLVSSYFFWPHTLRDRYCRVRYTNFVEMMVPCFSRDALIKVLFTFNENETGWGTEAHWASLIGNRPNSMAIIDEVGVVHTRPIQSGQERHLRDLRSYLAKFDLSLRVITFGNVMAEDDFSCDRETFGILTSQLENWILTKSVSASPVGMDGLLGHACALFLLSELTQKKKLADAGFRLLSYAQDGVFLLGDDMTVEHGIAGCCCLVEYLGRRHLIDDAPHELLSELYSHIETYFIANGESMSLAELVGVGKCLLLANGKNCDKLQGICRMLHERISQCRGRQVRPKTMRAMLEAISLLYECGYVDSSQVRDMSRNFLHVSYIWDTYCLYKCHLILREQKYLRLVRWRLRLLRIDQRLDMFEALILLKTLASTDHLMML